MLLRSFVAMMLLATVAMAESAAPPPHYDKWESFTVGDGLPSDKAMCVLGTEGDVWVGTDHGAARFRGGTWTTFKIEEGLVHDAVLGLAEDPQTGDIWFATMGGLSRLSAGRFQSFTQLNSGLVNNVVYSVAAYRGEIWSATAAGTSRLELADNRWSIYDETNTSMHEIWCYSVAAGKDRVYVAVWGGGLLEYDSERDRWKRYTDPDGEMEIDLFRDDGLIHDITAGVTVDDMDRVWVGTYFGLSSYDGRKWRNFMDHDSPLVSNFINFVRAHGEYCWIGTDSGLNASDREHWWTYRIDPDTRGGLATWHSEGEETVLKTRTIFPHDYILGISFQGDDIWVATEKGVARGRLTTERADNVKSPVRAGSG